MFDEDDDDVRHKDLIPVMGDSAVTRLGGIVGMRNGPTTSVGMIVIKTMPFSCANLQAACSAHVLETKYIWTGLGIINYN